MYFNGCKSETKTHRSSYFPFCSHISLIYFSSSHYLYQQNTIHKSWTEGAFNRCVPTKYFYTNENCRVQYVISNDSFHSHVLPQTDIHFFLRNYWIKCVMNERCEKCNYIHLPPKKIHLRVHLRVSRIKFSTIVDSRILSKLQFKIKIAVWRGSVNSCKQTTDFFTT